MPDDTFNFSKSGKFFDNGACANIAVDVPKDAALALALAANGPFPAGTIELAHVKAHASGGTGDLHFAGSAGTVSFRGSGGLRAGIGVYDSVTALLKDLDPDCNLLGDLCVGDSVYRRYLALNWGYDVTASVAGAMALGAGAHVKFGVDGSSEGLFAVVRGYAEDPPNCRDALAGLFESWMLPSQVKSPDHLRPGTWILAEVDGGIAARLGLQYGYDYSWIRNLNLNGVTGDVGLRIQAAVEATLGVTLSGKCLIAVSRESAAADGQTIRVQLRKLTKKGWDFALNACVGVQGMTGGFLGGELDSFLAAVFGVYGAQVVQDLKAFRDWTNPRVPLTRQLAQFVTTYAGNQALPETEARQRIDGFLKTWGSLDQRVSSVVWSALAQAGPAGVVFEEFIGAAAGDDAAVKTAITHALGNVDFFKGPVGQFLDSSVGSSLLGAAIDASAVQQVRAVAKEVQAILDGKALHNLVAYAGQNLGMQQIRDLAEGKSAPGDPNAWLVAKLEQFLGKQLDATGINQLRTTLHTLEARAEDLYKAGIAALHRKYNASLAFTYSSTTSTSPLLDVLFDFNANPGLSAQLQQAMSGDFEDLLLHPAPGVRLAQAALTHGLSRQSHLELNLPYFNETVDQMNDSLAKMSFAETDGRILMYELKADDKLIARRKWQGTLAINGKLAVNAGAVTVYGSQAERDAFLQYHARFRQALPDLRTNQLQALARPLVDEYFPVTFGGPLQPAKESFGDWLTDLDKLTDGGGGAGSGRLGDCCLTLDVVLPGKAVAAWLLAPSAGDDDPAYVRMSHNIQRSMRRLIPFCYFDDPGKYVENSDAPAAVLVYQSLPIGTTLLQQDSKTYWDFRDIDKRRAMVFSADTQAALLLCMDRVRNLLLQNPQLRGQADLYAPDQLGEICRRALTGASLEASLLFSEAETIQASVEAGQQLAKFLAVAGSDFDDALGHLAKFGQTVTATFNSRLSGALFGGRVYRELATLVFLAAAGGFDASVASVRPAARLDVLLLKPSAPKDWATSFLSGDNLKPEDVALEQPVVGLPS